MLSSLSGGGGDGRGRSASFRSFGTPVDDSVAEALAASHKQQIDQLTKQLEAERLEKEKAIESIASLETKVGELQKDLEEAKAKQDETAKELQAKDKELRDANKILGRKPSKTSVKSTTKTTSATKPSTTSKTGTKSTRERTSSAGSRDRTSSTGSRASTSKTGSKTPAGGKSASTSSTPSRTPTRPSSRSSTRPSSRAGSSRSLIDDKLQEENQKLQEQTQKLTEENESLQKRLQAAIQDADHYHDQLQAFKDMVVGQAGDLQVGSGGEIDFLQLQEEFKLQQEEIEQLEGLLTAAMTEVESTRSQMSRSQQSNRYVAKHDIVAYMSHTATLTTHCWSLRRRTNR